ncbi:hypothetical protein ACTD5D_40025 [Nocardia takedensis]|uniref:hypothetical protein n=1 Tax=Nocardia takedensis TaxID=259390 RepID=UPI003F768990
MTDIEPTGPESTPPGPDEEIRGRGRTSLALAAILLAVFVVAAAGVLVLRTSGDDPGADTGAGRSQGRTASSGSAAPSGGFGPPSADSQGRVVAHPNNPLGQPLSQSPVARGEYRCDPAPTCPAAEAPAGMVWQEVKPWVLPFTTSDGPARLDGPLALGYTRTPQGAAVALWQIVWRAASSRAVFDQVLARQITGTPEDLALLTASKQWDSTDTPAAALRPSAFRVTAWQDTVAVVQFAVPARDPGVWNVVMFEALWQDGDWKLRAPHTPTARQSIISLAGWTPW